MHIHTGKVKSWAHWIVGYSIPHCVLCCAPCMQNNNSIVCCSNIKCTISNKAYDKSVGFVLPNLSLKQCYVNMTGWLFNVVLLRVVYVCVFTIRNNTADTVLLKNVFVFLVWATVILSPTYDLYWIWWLFLF